MRLISFWNYTTLNKIVNPISLNLMMALIPEGYRTVFIMGRATPKQR